MSVQDTTTGLREIIIDNNGWGYEYESQNIYFAPSPADFFITYDIAWSPTITTEIGNRTRNYSGIFTVYLHVPEHSGDLDSLQKTDTIINAFYDADPKTYNTTQIRITSCEVGDTYLEDDMYVTEIDVNFQSFF